MLVGLMHGLAGSAALVVLTASTLDTPLSGIVFIVVFGLRQIMVIAVPISMTARWLTRVNQALQVAVALATMTVGCVVISKALPASFGV